jgi:hypothetical protein
MVACHPSEWSHLVAHPAKPPTIVRQLPSSGNQLTRNGEIGAEELGPSGPTVDPTRTYQARDSPPPAVEERSRPASCGFNHELADSCRAGVIAFRLASAGCRVAFSMSAGQGPRKDPNFRPKVLNRPLRGGDAFGHSQHVSEPADVPPDR